MVARTVAVVAVVALALAGAWLAIGHSASPVPANVRKAERIASANMARYCRGGYAKAERNASQPSGYEVIGYCPK